MATQKERLDGHDERLNRIEAALGLKPPEPPKSFLKQKYEWAINHKGTSLILAVILCFVGIFGKYWIDHKHEWWAHDVVEIIDQSLNAKGGVKETLASIQNTVNRTEVKLNTLEPFIHDVVIHQFENASKLPAKDLSQRLPALQHLIAVAQDQKVAVDPLVVRTIERNLLRTTAALPSSWAVSNQMLSYYTSLNPPSDADFQKAGFVIFKGTDENKECVDMKAGAHGLGMRHIVFEHCTQHFDSGVGPIIYIDSVFKDVRVIYGGGNVTFQTVTFINCRFELAPTEASKVLAGRLLASTSIERLSLP